MYVYAIFSVFRSGSGLYGGLSPTTLHRTDVPCPYLAGHIARDRTAFPVLFGSTAMPDVIVSLFDWRKLLVVAVDRVGSECGAYVLCNTVTQACCAGGIGAMAAALGCCASTSRGARCKPMQSSSGCRIRTYLSTTSLAEEWVPEFCTRKCLECRWVTIHSIRQLLRKSTRGKLDNTMMNTSCKLRGWSKGEKRRDRLSRVVGFIRTESCTVLRPISSGIYIWLGFASHDTLNAYWSRWLG